METDLSTNRDRPIGITRSHAALKLGFAVGKCAEVSKIVQVLKLLNEAYRGLCQWEELTDSHCESLSDAQPLCLATLETSAPAQLEIVGAHAPIDRLRFYLQQQRDRRDETLLDSLSGTIAQLRARNIPETQLQAVLSEYLLAPLRRLTACAELSLLDEDNTPEQFVS